MIVRSRKGSYFDKLNFVLGFFKVRTVLEEMAVSADFPDWLWNALQIIGILTYFDLILDQNGRGSSKEQRLITSVKSFNSQVHERDKPLIKKRYFFRILQKVLSHQNQEVIGRASDKFHRCRCKGHLKSDNHLLRLRDQRPMQRKMVYPLTGRTSPIPVPSQGDVLYIK